MFCTKQIYKLWVGLMFFISLPMLVFGAGDADGSSCENAIPAVDGMSLSVEEAGSVWYTAHTYDLPLTMVFVPVNQSATSKAPIAYFDFSCTTGVYDNEILDRYFNPRNPSHVPMPITYSMEKKVEDGVIKYVLSVPITYRDLLAKVGLTESIPVYVRVDFPETGSVDVESNSHYSTCLTGGPVLNLNQKVSVEPRDTNAYAILPYGTYRMDSIHYYWTGDKPAKVWMMADCNELTADTTSAVMESWVMQPGEKRYLSLKEVRERGDYYVDKWGIEGDLVYMHVTSESKGEMHINATPMAPADSGAILLEYGKPVSADSTKLYYFPKSWLSASGDHANKQGSICFYGNTDYTMDAYFNSTGSFHLPVTNVNSLLMRRKFTFSRTPDGRELDLSTKEVTGLVSGVTGNYVYVRFRTRDPKAKVTLWEWEQNDCASRQTENLPMGTTITKSPNVMSYRYRVRQGDISGGDLTISIKLSKAYTVYFATECSDGLQESSPKVNYYKDIKTTTATKLTIKSSDIEKWKTDDDGFVYLIVKTTSSNATGNFKVDTTRPPEVDPEPDECRRLVTAKPNVNGWGNVMIEVIDEL